jgi:probable rRNA maturation factor
MTAAVTVFCSDEQEAIPMDIERWRALAEEVLLAEGKRGELSVTFVDETEIADLNVEFMGHEGPTDVLSFPLDVDEVDEIDAVPGMPVMLGDVVICPTVAERAAAGHAGTFIDEIALLLVHGILHVLGHDHDAEPRTSLMRTRELELLEQCHWKGSAPEGFAQVHADDSSI